MRATEEELREWMVASLDGDEASYRALLMALVPILRGFFGRHVRIAADIEDLIQDTLIALDTRRGTYDRSRRFTTWLFAIARHKMIDHYRRSRTTCSIDTVEHILISEGFEAQANAQLDVERLLATLPPKQARAIRSTRLDGASVAEVSEAEQIGQSDVKVSVHRGLKALAARVLGMDR